MMTQSAAFQCWYDRFEQSGDLGEVRLGITRDDLRSWFGEPDDTARGFRRRPLMGIWRYGIVEFHFSDTGGLFLVYSEQPDLVPRVILSEAAGETPKHER
jgi:hypothetical protein